MVFVRHDGVRRPLQAPYDGPYQVLEAGKKVFKILRNGLPYTVSVDRLKVCNTTSPRSSLVPNQSPPPPHPARPSSWSSPSSSPSTSAPALPLRLRCRRRRPRLRPQLGSNHRRHHLQSRVQFHLPRLLRSLPSRLLTSPLMIPPWRLSLIHI